MSGLVVEKAVFDRAWYTGSTLGVDGEVRKAGLVGILLDGHGNVAHVEDLTGKPVNALDLEDGVIGFR